MSHRQIEGTSFDGRPDGHFPTTLKSIHLPDVALAISLASLPNLLILETLILEGVSAVFSRGATMAETEAARLPKQVYEITNRFVKRPAIWSPI